jgi:hypothetical protein
LVYDNFDISVFNVLGQQVDIDVRDKSLNVINVDLKHAVPGVYFVKVINAGEKLTSSIVMVPVQ